MNTTYYEIFEVDTQKLLLWKLKGKTPYKTLQLLFRLRKNGINLMYKSAMLYYEYTDSVYDLCEPTQEEQALMDSGNRTMFSNFLESHGWTLQEFMDKRFT